MKRQREQKPVDARPLCAPCRGRGYLDEQVTVNVPGYGTYTAQKQCGACNGKGEQPPPAVVDGRARAAGERGE